MVAVALYATACGGGIASQTPSTDALVKRLPLPTSVTTLPNGLKVILHEDRRAPLVAVRVVYHVGSSNDPPGRSGFAHLFEHFMFEGSAHVARGMFDTLLARAGATGKNATTTRDATCYYETVPAAQLDLALFLESDRMGFLLPMLNQGTLDNVRDVVKNEYRQRIDNVPYGLLPLVIDPALFPPGHPYHRSTIGSFADLDGASLDDIQQFWLRWYGPNNATLILVGDFSSADALARVRHWFGDIKSGPPLPQLPALPPVLLEKEKRILIDAGVTLPRVVLAWSTPAYGEPGEVALGSAASLLEWSASSYLIKKLEMAHALGVWSSPGRFGGTLELQATLKATTDPEKALSEIQLIIDEISKFSRDYVDEKSVHESLYGLYAGQVFDLDGLAQRAETYGFFDLVSRAPDALPKRLRSIEALGPEGVIEAYRSYVLRAPPVVAIVRPRDGAPQAGRVVEK